MYRETPRSNKLQFIGMYRLTTSEFSHKKVSNARIEITELLLKHPKVKLSQEELKSLIIMAAKNHQNDVIP